MRLLAIETATEACSVALSIDGRISERFVVAPRRHAELVLPMAQDLLAEAGIARSSLDAIAVGRGPGAFTGVRLAIAVAQGIALALDRPIATVSTLAALALGAVDDLGPEDARGAFLVLAAIDARMGEIYAGRFVPGPDGLVRAAGDEVLVAADALAPGAAPQWVIAGTGLGTYRDALLARLDRAPLAEFPEALPTAAAVARLGAREIAQGRGVDAALAQPVYLRDKVALTVAEQKQG